MTVYELIQELSRYKADAEVLFHAEATFSADVEACFDRNNENDTQDATVDVQFDDYVDLVNTKQRLCDKNTVIVDLKY